MVGVQVVYFSYTRNTPSSALRKTLHNMHLLAGRDDAAVNQIEVAFDG